MTAKFRLQSSDHLGVAQRGWGFGRVTRWSKWRTVAQFDSLADAEAVFAQRSRVGLSRWRVVLRGEVVKASL